MEDYIEEKTCYIEKGYYKDKTFYDLMLYNKKTLDFYYQLFLYDKNNLKQLTYQQNKFIMLYEKHFKQKTNELKDEL